MFSHWIVDAFVHEEVLMSQWKLIRCAIIHYPVAQWISFMKLSFVTVESDSLCHYGVASISRLLKIICLFCKILYFRALLQKRTIILRSLLIVTTPYRLSRGTTNNFPHSYEHEIRTKHTLWSKSNTLQHTTTHCNTLQHTATHCNTLQHTATHCNTLQHTATYCNV